MVIQVTNYVFAPGGAGAGTITFSGYVSIELKNVILITNVTDGEIIYNFRIPGNTGTVVGNVLTLMESTAAMSAGDELAILYNDVTKSADTSTLATQTTLDLVRVAVQALAAIVTGGTLDISGAVTVTSGAITETNSAAIKSAVEILAAIVTGGTLDISGTVTANAGTDLNTSLLSLESTQQSVLTSLQLLDNTVAGNELQVDVVTDPPLLAATDSVLIYGTNDGGTTKIPIKTDATGEIQVDISSSTLALEATLQSVKTAVEVLAAIVTGGTLDISGTVTADAGSNLNTSALALEATMQSILTGIGQIEAAVEIIDDAIAGNEMQVDVLTLPIATKADDATTPDNPVMIGGTAKETDGTDPGSVSAEDDVTRAITDRNRRILVNDAHPNLWSVNENHSSAQTNNELKAAPGLGFSLYITDITISNGATAGSVTIVRDTGGTPANVAGPFYFAINGGLVKKQKTPIRIPANQNVGFSSSTVTTHTVEIEGYIAP